MLVEQNPPYYETIVSIIIRTINIAFKWLNANELNINRVKVLYKVYW